LARDAEPSNWVGIDMKYTRFEKARIIGARALQIDWGAPILIEVPEGVIDSLLIAESEFEKRVIPITVKRDESDSANQPPKQVI